MAPKKSPNTFANALTEVEALAKRLEDNDNPIEQSLKDFENGIQLIRQAQETLQVAEQKVHILLDQQGEQTGEPLIENGKLTDCKDAL